MTSLIIEHERMSNPVITLANNTPYDKSVVSLNFEKDFTLAGQQLLGHESSKATKICPTILKNGHNRVNKPRLILKRRYGGNDNISPDVIANAKKGMFSEIDQLRMKI